MSESGSSDSTSIMSRLAWRAKWRNRWRKWRTWIIGSTVVLVIFVVISAFAPWGPRWVENRIKQQNPVTQPIQPGATESLFKLGRFYQITMRDEEAAEIYTFMLSEWYYNPEHRRAMGIETGEPWVGKALFFLAEIERRRLHKERAYKYFEQYLRDFGRHPDSDPTLNRQAQTAVATFRQG